MTPHSRAEGQREIEEAVLGAMLVDPTVVDRLRLRLGRRSFVTACYQQTFDELVQLYETAGAIDVVLLRDALRRAGLLEKLGGTAFLERIAATPTAAAVDAYVDLLLKAEALREVRAVAERLSLACERDDFNEVLQALDAASETSRASIEIRDQIGTRPTVFERGVESASNLLYDDPPVEPEWLIGDRLAFRGGTSILTGPFKSRKSLILTRLALDFAQNTMALTGAADGEFLGSPILRGGPVLYLHGEGGRWTISERLRVMGPRLGREVFDRVRVWSRGKRPDLSRPADVRDIYRYAHDAGCAAVMFDPLGRFWHPHPDQDPAEAANHLMDDLEHESIAAHVWTIVANHDTKSGGTSESGASAGRGSGKLADDASCSLINIKAVDAKRSAWECHFVVRHGAPIEPRRLELDPSTLRVFVPDDPSDALHGRRGVRHSESDWNDVLPPDGSAISESDIASIWDCTQRHVHQSFQRTEVRTPWIVREPGGGRGHVTRYRRRTAETSAPRQDGVR